MPVATYSDFKNRMGQLIPIPFTKSSVLSSTGTSSLCASTWSLSPRNGATPSTSSALNSTTTGALNNNPNISTSSLLARASINGSAGQMSLLVIDRLVHQGGLSGIVTTEQTTNLPTSALTRYTSGVGVMVGIEIYGGTGVTSTTATLNYTNQSGTSGRTSKATVITASPSSGRFFIVPLADGDTGVRSVQGVTLAGSTGSAGNFGVTLFKPLSLSNPVFVGLETYGTNNYNALIGSACQFDAVDPDACISLLACTTSNNVTVAGVLNFMDIT